MRFFISLTTFILLFTGASLYGQTGGEPVDGESGRDTIEFVLEPSGSEPTGSSSGLIWVDSIIYDGQVIRFSIRLTEEIRRDSARLRALIDSIQNATSEVIAANLHLDPSDWHPTAEEKMRREEMIRAAQDHEWIYPQKITHIPVFSVPLSSIGQTFGLVEDVTPRIAYTLPNTRQISVIVYTQSALPVVTLVDGTQKPGEYSFDWDFNDANGRRPLPGNYFVEVIADGVELLLRKRIVVP